MKTFFRFMVFLDTYLVRPVWTLLTPADFSPRFWDEPLTNFCLWANDGLHEAKK